SFEFESVQDFSSDFDFSASDRASEESFTNERATEESLSPQPEPEAETNAGDFSFAGHDEADDRVGEANFELAATTQTENLFAAKVQVDETEFYRRRAIDEVTSLQMVEHVFSGVEREQMRILPKPFNDITVKKALHDFLQVSKNSTASENAQAEFKLMQETESWCSALSHRDKHLSVSALRRYCETTKPSLSNQAIIALARFYRNLPHTESVRSKFDMIMTRLFTREVKGERRELLFDRDDIVRQINELYADWASVPLYSVEDETELLLTTVKFDDFLAEAQDAGDFDELVRKDFYNRLRLFKESVGDKFYAPLVLASAIESNVLIGNRYVELLEREREHTSAEAIESQYSFLLDQAISDATSKTLQLVELLREKTEIPASAAVAAAVAAAPAEQKKNDEPKENPVVSESAKVEHKKAKASKIGFFGISQWLVFALTAVILLSAALYMYVEYHSQLRSSPSVQKVNLENSAFKDYLQTARINQETFIGVVTPAWDVVNEDKKLEMLGKLMSVGREKGFSKVHLLNNEGKTVGYASESGSKVINPDSI
ncbi:MAG: hypothetical protein M3384_21595, partial [Acidobacteriota bacterium]|nr:hypothetical protein [Acidobacteriota bacterium]